MRSGRLDQYKGMLTPAQAAEGMTAANRQGALLAADAISLLEIGRVSTSTALAILAIEESGKSSILRGLVLARNGKDLKEAWRDYRSHTKKNVLGGLVDAVRGGARRLSEFYQLVDAEAEFPRLLDQIKQVGLYTDCLGDAHWSSPSEVIDEESCRSLIEVAQILASNREVKTLEMELWVRPLGPVWMRSPELIGDALVSWYESMQEAGLKAPGENRMMTFIRTGVRIPRHDDERPSG